MIQNYTSYFAIKSDFIIIEENKGKPKNYSEK